MTPYRGVRYHLKEQARAGLKPRTKEELFNLRHTSLRNVIERQFGVLKRRFKIIRSAPEFAMPIQVRLVYALTAINNFITRSNLSSNRYQLEGYQDHNILNQDSESMSLSVEPGSPTMNASQDAIAVKMWVDYCRYIGVLGGG